MEFHPRDVPVSKTYDLKDEADANEAVQEMVGRGFEGHRDGYRVLMPKEQRTAKRIGYAVTTGITAGLRQRGEDRDVKYWTYHHDERHYAIVLIHRDALEQLGLG